MIIQRGTDRIVEVSDDEIAGAIRILYTATHSCAEGAGAAALAGLIRERERLGGRRAAVIVSGQNIDRGWMQTVLAGGTPRLCPEVRPVGHVRDSTRSVLPLANSKLRRFSYRLISPPARATRLREIAAMLHSRQRVH